MLAPKFLLIIFENFMPSNNPIQKQNNATQDIRPLPVYPLSKPLYRQSNRSPSPRSINSLESSGTVSLPKMRGTSSASSTPALLPPPLPIVHPFHENSVSQEESQAAIDISGATQPLQAAKHEEDQEDDPCFFFGIAVSEILEQKSSDQASRLTALVKDEFSALPSGLQKTANYIAVLCPLIAMTTLQITYKDNQLLKQTEPNNIPLEDIFLLFSALTEQWHVFTEPFPTEVSSEDREEILKEREQAFKDLSEVIPSLEQYLDKGVLAFAWEITCGGTERHDQLAKLEYLKEIYCKKIANNSKNPRWENHKVIEELENMKELVCQEERKKNLFESEAKRVCFNPYAPIMYPNFFTYKKFVNSTTSFYTIFLEVIKSLTEIKNYSFKNKQLIFFAKKMLDSANIGEVCLYNYSDSHAWLPGHNEAQVRLNDIYRNTLETWLEIAKNINRKSKLLEALIQGGIQQLEMLPDHSPGIMQKVISSEPFRNLF